VSKYSLAHLSDQTLLSELTALVARDRSITAQILAHLAEVDTRKLYAPAGYPSLRAWCVGALGLSEDAAHKRIQAARAARDFPILFTAVAEGRLHLTAVGLLAPYLAPSNAEGLVEAAAGKSKQQIEELLAERFPRTEALPMVESHEVTPAGQLAPAQVGTDTPGSIRGTEPAAGKVTANAPRSRVSPVALARYALTVSIGRVTLNKLTYAQELLSHEVREGDLSRVLDRVLDIAISQLEKRKFAATSASRPARPTRSARHIPARAKRAIWTRDGGRCTFVADDGRRCGARTLLEFDHVIPVARGGIGTVENLRLRCRAHNQHGADRAFGRDFMSGKRRCAELEKQTRQAVRARQAKERAQEVIPWLRKLGYRADQAREAAVRCEAMTEASLEERMKVALSYLAPRAVTHRPSSVPSLEAT